MTWNPTDDGTPARGRGRNRRHPHGGHHDHHQHHAHHPGRGPERDDFGPRGPERRGGRGRGERGPGRRGRTPRGDVRAAVLVLLAEEPMHGYQLMQAIAERSNGRWTPSPGAIYPVLSQLEDEGLVLVTAESGRKVASLTEAGRTAAGEADQTRDPFAADQGHDGPDLRALVQGIGEATRQVARTGSPEQLAKATDVLTRARRDLYLVLAGVETPEAAAEED